MEEKLDEKDHYKLIIKIKKVKIQPNRSSALYCNKTIVKNMNLILILSGLKATISQ